MKMSQPVLSGKIVLLVLLNLSLKSSAVPAEKLFNVGYRVIDISYKSERESRTITVAVWYPTSEDTKPFQYGGPTWGDLAVDAAVVPGQYPFLAFSHGFSGSGLSPAFFTESLAARGWIVACPDHYDSYSFARIRTGRTGEKDRSGAIDAAREITLSSPAERGKYMYRPEELAAVIKGMMNSEYFGDFIDKEKIAVGGHSFGGFTSLALCGTIPELFNPSIKAVLMFSTGAASYLFTEDELASVRIPSMLFMGSRERKQKRGEKTMSELSDRIFRNVSSPKYFLEIRGATHFSFNTRLSSGPGTKLLSGSRREFETINLYSVAFLEKYVAGRPGQEEILNKKARMLMKFIYVPVDYSRPRAKE